MKKRVIVIGAVLLLVVVGAVIALRGTSVAVQVASPVTMTVREYVAEEAKTRLAHEYIVDMPVTGTVMRVALEVGDEVKKGQIVAAVDPYDIQQNLRRVEAQISQRQAQMLGVDVAKPKPEDIESAKLRVAEMRNALEIAQKAITVTQANFELASSDLARAKGLLEAGAASESFVEEAQRRYTAFEAELNQRRIEVDRARQALEQAQLAEQRLVGSIDDNEYQREVLQAEVAALQSELAMLADDLKKTEIKSPVTGPILDKFVEDSRVLPEGTELLRLGDMESIEIESDILSEEVTAIRPGDPVIVFGKALRGNTLQGSVKRIFPSGFEKISSLGVEQQRVKTLIDFDNSEAKLRPGTSVDVEIITAESPDALAVPDRAVFRHGDKWAVFVVADGRAELRHVDVGLRNEDWAEIRDGLESTDIVIAELTNDIVPGVRVSHD